MSPLRPCILKPQALILIVGSWGYLGRRTIQQRRNCTQDERKNCKAKPQAHGQRLGRKRFRIERNSLARMARTDAQNGRDGFKRTNLATDGTPLSESRNSM